MNEQRIPRSWLMLVLGTGGQTASTTILYGLPFLVPAFQRQYGLTLTGAGYLVSCPIVGILLGLIGWGVVADRYGERLALSAGLLCTGAVLAVAVAVHQVRLLGVLLVLAGAFGASVNSASGRLVIGWFPPDRRGIAMGVRQASQPHLAPASRRPRCHPWPRRRGSRRRWASARCCARSRGSPLCCSPSIRRAPRSRRECGPPRRTRAGTCGGCTPSPRCCVCRSSW
jgi:hypothetical protein